MINTAPEAVADGIILQSGDGVENREPGDSPILEEEVEKAVRMLKDGKAPGVDNIPAEILKHGGPSILDTLTIVCQQIPTSRQGPKDWTKSLIYLLPKKGSRRLCQNYRVISLIGHPSKAMLRVILNRRANQAEQIWEQE